MQKKSIHIICAVFLILSMISPVIHAAGSAGDAGKTPYEVLVDNGYQGSMQDFLASLAGKGDAISPYQLAELMGYQGSEEDWLNILSGNWVQKDTPMCYTVTFQDHDGTVLKVETVESGSSATAPEDPVREGYTFTGWDAAFDQVICDLTVTAQYQIANEFTLTMDSATVKAGDTQVELTISIVNNPGVIGLVAKLEYDDSVLTITKAEKGEAFEELSYQKPSKFANGCNLIFYAAETTEVLDGEAFTLLLDVAEDAQPGTYPIRLIVTQDAVINGNTRVPTGTATGNITIE